MASLSLHLETRLVVGRMESIWWKVCLLSSRKWFWRHLKRQGIIRSREKMAARGPSRGINHVSIGDQNPKGWACVMLGYCCLILEVTFWRVLTAQTDLHSNSILLQGTYMSVPFPPWAHLMLACFGGWYQQGRKVGPGEVVEHWKRPQWDGYLFT
jgi:hypothetical protein